MLYCCRNVFFRSLGVAFSKRRRTSATLIISDCMDFNPLRALLSSLWIALADLSPEASALAYAISSSLTSFRCCSVLLLLFDR